MEILVAGHVVLNEETTCPATNVSIVRDAQAQDKRNFYNLLHHQAKKVQEEDHFFVHIEWKNARNHRHKLAEDIEGPFYVKETNGDTVVIEIPDQIFEIV